MIFRHKNMVVFTVAILVSVFKVVHNLQEHKQDAKKLIYIASDLSRVSNKLQGLLNNYIQLHEANKLIGTQGKSDNERNKEEKNRKLFNDDTDEDIPTDSINENLDKINSRVKSYRNTLDKKDSLEKNRKLLRVPNHRQGYDGRYMIIWIRNKILKNKRYKTSIRNTYIPISKKINKSRPSVLSDSDSEEDKTIQNVIKRANALRQAYGDACTTLVVRKCLKALRATLKQVCKSSGRQCTREYNALFKIHATSGCFYYFLNQAINVTTNIYDFNNNFNINSRIGNIQPIKPPKIQPKEMNGEDSSSSSSSSSEEENNTGTAGWRRDFTRNGYMDTACLRTFNDEIEPPEETTGSASVDPNMKKVNILRGRLEKACQKSSYRKCCAAGKYASLKACAMYPCVKEKVKLLKKSNKRNCAEIYGYNSHSSESDED